MVTLEEKIYDICLKSKETNPISLFNLIISIEGIPMHGPIHHFIIPAVFLTCYNNLYSDNNLKEKLNIASKRAMIVPGGFCANYGACGAGLGVGIFVSIITDNNPLKQKSWSQTIISNAKCQTIIAKNGGPRCCKRNGYLAILAGIQFAKEEFNLDFSTTDNIECFKSQENTSCKKEACLFYKR
ncbi:DUF5714 domain-containing protein [Acholeplasma sp. OttesenSCG-928-E16]|nr:DUF5714 domain-containing protein [Acholeplasma sp. OttesenSCG-928-E16]